LEDHVNAVRRRWARVVLASALLIASASCGSSPAADDATSATTGLVDIGAGIQGPVGLQAMAVAHGLENVSALAVAADGALWAATAAFSDDGTDAVWRVAESGSPTAVIPSLHTPLGLAWIGTELFVASKNDVSAYGGFDGTSFATQRNVLALPDGIGEVNGLVLGPDGRLHLGISAACDHCLPKDERSGAVLSFTTDGQDVRVDATHIRAPIDLTYRAGTDDLYVTMNLRDDLGDKTPGDWLAVVDTGSDWGFPDCYGQGGDACAGVPDPLATLDAHAALSGVALVEDSLGPDLRSSAIVAEWATGVVRAVPLDGEDHTSRVLLTGLQKPMPVELASDGAVLVGDWATGTVYRITTRG
jgi:glucose/arabinose dehydrogenase